VFGLDTHMGAADARLALAGVLIDRNEIAAAIAAFRHRRRSFRPTRLPASTRYLPINNFDF
jgi:hypothetical protein